MPPVVEPLAATDRYTLHMACEPSQVIAAQRLRFEVFNLEMGEGLATSAETGLDVDVFDAVCQHLLVVEISSGAVVGTYRMQTGNNAAAHLGYYSAREFDFKPFEMARGEIVELGRACVAVAHRNQSVLGLLWKGIARYAQSQRARYLIGCSSLTSQDQAQGLAAYAKLAECALAPLEWRTMPVEGWRCQSCGVEVEAVPVPRLMSAYLAAGAKICGEPAIDREFGTIDFLTWMDLQAMPQRVLRKFMG
jgi:putative hemolysin